MTNSHTIPNYLSVYRLLAGPMIIGVFLHYGQEITILFESIWVSLYVIACLTDGADGYIARRWPSQASDFGKVIDPLADKALVISIIALIYLVDSASWWELSLMSVIILREVSVTLARKPFIGETDILSVIEVGRWKAGFQMVAFGVMLGREGITAGHFDKLIPHFPFDQLGSFLLVIATVLTLVSGYEYLKGWLSKSEQSQVH